MHIVLKSPKVSCDRLNISIRMSDGSVNSYSVILHNVLQRANR